MPAQDQPRIDLLGPPTSGLAKASLALAILGIVPLGPLASIPGAICGHLALRRIRRSGGAVGGRRVALSALVIAYLAMALWAAAVRWWIRWDYRATSHHLLP